MSETDLELLARYTQTGAEDAFTELVHRHLDFVFSTAMRQLRSPQLAEEVAQSVFSDLARQADRLTRHTVLPAWLYQVTRRTAIDVVRGETRRQAREQVALELNAMNAPDADWAQVEPLLDEAMHALEEKERTAVLLCYFRNNSLREIGEALGTTEEAARKRVTRAVEHLRQFFTKRGVTVGTSGLAVIISAHAVQAAPAGLATTITTAALGGKSIAAAAGSGLKAITAAAKCGPVTKGAIGIGSLGGLLATLGGVFVTVRAQIGDTKSPRERQFFLQVIGLRIVAALGGLAALLGTWQIPHGTLAYYMAFAAALFVLALIMVLLFDYTSRHQRRIQMEDGTYLEAEWTLPRSQTEAASGRASRRWLRFKAVGFLVFFLVWFALMVLAAPRTRDQMGGAIMACGLAVTFVLGFLHWERRPRFQSLRPGSLLLIAGSMCGLTLLHFDLTQGESVFLHLRSSSWARVFLFNAGVFLVYAAFVGVFAWKRNWLFRRRGGQSDPFEPQSEETRNE